MTVNSGHHMYLCSRDSKKGKLNGTSVCGNHFYQPLDPIAGELLNERAYDYLIVEPLYNAALIQTDGSP